MKKYLLALASSVFTLLFATSAWAAGEVISVNIIGGNWSKTGAAIPEGKSAGVISLSGAYWNNLIQRTGSHNAFNETFLTLGEYAEGRTVLQNIDVVMTARAACCYTTKDSVAETAGGDNYLVQGYLDDGQTDSGYGAQVTFNGIPYSSYDLYIYCGTDQTDASAALAPVEVNGTVYPSDAAWGSRASIHSDTVTLTENENYIKISGLQTSSLTIKGKRIDGGRVGLAGFQIVNQGTVADVKTYDLTEKGAVTTSLSAIQNMTSAGIVEITLADGATLELDGTFSIDVLKIKCAGSCAVNASESADSFANVKFVKAAGVDGLATLNYTESSTTGFPPSTSKFWDFDVVKKCGTQTITTSVQFANQQLIVGGGSLTLSAKTENSVATESQPMTVTGQGSYLKLQTSVPTSGHLKAADNAVLAVSGNNPFKQDTTYIRPFIHVDNATFRIETGGASEHVKVNSITLSNGIIEFSGVAAWHEEGVVLEGIHNNPENEKISVTGTSNEFKYADDTAKTAGNQVVIKSGNLEILENAKLTSNVGIKGAIKKQGKGELVLNVANPNAELLTVEAGTVTVTATGAWAGAVSLAETGVISFDVPADTSFAKAVSGSGTIVKKGLGTFELPLSAEFTGTVDVQEGSAKLPLAIAKTATMSSGTLTVVLTDEEQLANQTVSKSGVTVIFVDKDNNTLASENGVYTAPIKTWTITADDLTDGGVTWSDDVIWKANGVATTAPDATSIARIEIGDNDVQLTLASPKTITTLEVIGEGTLTFTGTNALTVNFVVAESDVSFSSAMVKTAENKLPAMSIAEGKQIECTFASNLDIPVLTGTGMFVKKGKDFKAVLKTDINVEPRLHIKEGVLDLPSYAGYYSNEVYTDLPDIIIEGQSTLFLSEACTAVKDGHATVTLLNGGIFKFKNGNTFAGDRVVNCAFLIQNDGTTPAEFQGSINGSGSTINGNITGYGQLKFTEGPGNGFYKINGIIADENKDEGKVLSLVFADPQEIQLAGANTYSGGTEIGAGTTLVVNGNTTALGAGSVTGAGNIRLDSSLYLAGDIKSSGTITFNGGHGLYGTGEINGPSIVMHANGVLGHEKNGKVTVTVAKDKSLTGGGTVNADVTYAEGAILDVRGDTPNYAGDITFGGAITLKVSEAKIGTEILTKVGLTAPKATIYVGDNTTSDNTLILKATDTGLAVVKAAAMVGNTPFETLTAALASDVEGTVQLVEALTISEATTLNLNGKTVSGTLVVNADTHISGNGKLTGIVSGSGSLIVDENVTLVVENSDKPFVDGYVVKVEGILQLTGGGYGFFTIEGNGTTEIPDEASFTIGVDGSKSDGVRGNIKTHLDVAGTLSVRFFDGNISTYEITPKSVDVSGQIQKDATYGVQSTILVPALTGTGTIGLDVAFAEDATLDASEVTAEKCLTITGAVTLPETGVVAVTLPENVAEGMMLLKASHLDAAKFNAEELDASLKLEATAEGLVVATAVTTAEVASEEALATALANENITIITAIGSFEIAGTHTLASGKTLIIPEDVTVTATSTATLTISGTIEVAGALNGYALSYGTSGLVPQKGGIVKIGEKGTVIMPKAWEGYNRDPNTNMTVVGDCTEGATIIIGNNEVWKCTGEDAWTRQVAKIGTTYYATLQAAIEAAADDSTVTIIATVDWTGFNFPTAVTIAKLADLELTAPEGYKWDNNTLVKAAIGNGATSGEIETVEDIATAIKTGNAITFADSVEVVKGDDGKVTVTVGGESTTLNLPAYYDAAVDGNTLSVTLNDTAKPVIAATEETETDESIPALEVTAEGLKINLPKLETALTYKLWGATSLEKDAEGKVSWKEVDSVEGQASHTFTGGTTYKFFKIVVTD